MNVEFKTKMGHHALIRRLVAEDASNVLEYLKTVGGETNYLLLDERGLEVSVDEEKAILDRFYHHPISLLIGCFIDGELASVANLSVSDRWKIRHIGKIGVSVKKKFWRQRIGFKMMEIMIEYAKSKQQLDIIQLEVRTDNYNAINLYETLGFFPVGTIPKATKIDGHFYDHHIMVLYL